MELAFDAHIAAVLLGVSRLLDRDRRATSLQWLVRVVRERPERFKLEPDEISTQVDALEARAPQILQVRNKLLAHHERLEPDRTRELLSVQADALAKTGEILDAIDAVVKAVTGSDQVRDWSWVMIAFEPWAEGVLATLRRDVGTLGAGSR